MDKPWKYCSKPDKTTTNIILFLLYDIIEIGQCKETKSGLDPFLRSWREGEMERPLLKGYRASVWHDKKVLETGVMVA